MTASKEAFLQHVRFHKLSDSYFLFHNPPDTNISSIEWSWHRLSRENRISFISHHHLIFRVVCGKSMISYLSLRRLQSCCRCLENLFLMDIYFLTYCTAGAVFQPYKACVPIIAFSNLLFRIHILLLRFRKSYLHLYVWEWYVLVYICTCTHA